MLEKTGLCPISGTQPSQTLSCGPTSLAAGASVSVHITATTSKAECTSYDNTATASSTNDGGGTANAKIFFFNDTATTEIYTLSLHDALPISIGFTVTVSNTGTGEATGV